jgi:hypothetical protein
LDVFKEANGIGILEVARALGLQPERHGGRWRALCPLHDDHEPSLYFDAKKNLWKCFGCDRGGTNVDLVLAVRRAAMPKEAAEWILRHFGREPGPGDAPYTLEDYAREKALPPDFLKALGLQSDQSRIRIPYWDREGKEVAARFRRGRRFWWPKGAVPLPYGLDRLDGFLAEHEYLVLVEGESDTQTLWLHGYPALGIPGAQSFKNEWAEFLLPARRLYLHREPDEAGGKFVARVARAMKKAGYAGEILEFRIPGHKDPNDLHRANPDPEAFQAAFDAALAAAAPAEPGKEEENGETEPQGPRAAEEIIAALQDDPLEVFRQPVLGALAALPAAEQARVKAALKGRVSLNDLNRALKEERIRQGLHLRLVEGGEALPTTREVLGTSCPADLPVPPGWQITEQGVYEVVTRYGEAGRYQVVEKRFPVPVVLSRVQVPLDPAAEGLSYELAWMNGTGEWHRTAWPAEVLFDRSKLIVTASAGLPVDSENARGLLRWLAALRDTRAVPAQKVVTRCGWHGKLFVLGTQILDSGRVDKMLMTSTAPLTASIGSVDDVADDLTNRVDWSTGMRGSERTLIEAIRTGGSAERQARILRAVIRRYPLAGFLIGAAAAAPLVRWLHEAGLLDVKGFIVEVVSDQAGVGKTTGQELAASVFGNPGHLLRTFDRTAVGWEVLLHTLCDCPVFLEEAQLAAREDLAMKLVYALGQGMGRERGNRSGGLRTTKVFYNTVLLASERSLKSFASREGVEARVITIPPVFGRKDPARTEELRRLRAACYRHYGHAGRAYVEALLKLGKQHIIERYEATYERVLAAMPRGAASAEGLDGEVMAAATRLATRVAACWVGLELLLEALDKPLGVPEARTQSREGAQSQLEGCAAQRSRGDEAPHPVRVEGGPAFLDAGEDGAAKHGGQCGGERSNESEGRTADGITDGPGDAGAHRERNGWPGVQAAVETCILTAWGEVLQQLDAVPLWKRALAVLQSFVAENVHRLAGMEPVVDGKVRVPSNGYIGGLVTAEGKPAVALFPNVFDEVIERRLKIEATTVRKGLAREGALLRDGQGRYTRNQRITPKEGESFTARVLCIPRELIFPEEEAETAPAEIEVDWDETE